MAKENEYKNSVLELSGDILVLEEIADNIERMARAFKILKNSRLKEDTIITLIQSKTGINRKEIKSVLDVLTNLDSFLKPKQ